jgi:hypothetical protein
MPPLRRERTGARLDKYPDWISIRWFAPERWSCAQRAALGRGDTSDGQSTAGPAMAVTSANISRAPARWPRHCKQGLVRHRQPCSAQPSRHRIDRCGCGDRRRLPLQAHYAMRQRAENILAALDTPDIRSVFWRHIPPAGSSRRACCWPHRTASEAGARSGDAARYGVRSWTARNVPDPNGSAA